MVATTIALFLLIGLVLIFVALVLRKKTDILNNQKDTFVQPPKKEPVTDLNKDEKAVEPQTADDKQQVFNYPTENVSGTRATALLTIKELKPIEREEILKIDKGQFNQITFNISNYKSIAEHNVARIYNFDLLNGKGDNITQEQIDEKNEERNNRVYIISNPNGTRAKSKNDIEAYINLVGHNSEYVSGEHALLYIKDNYIQLKIMEGKDVFVIDENGKVKPLPSNPYPIDKESTFIFAREVIQIVDCRPRLV